MVTIVREGDSPYCVSYSLVPLEEVAGKVKEFPAAWIDESGSMISSSFFRYVSPLIQGEVEVPFKGGIPEYVLLQGAKKAEENLFRRRNGGQ
jgi:6-phosphofructokinase 1